MSARFFGEILVAHEGREEQLKPNNHNPFSLRPGYYTDTHEDAIIMWQDDLAGGEAEARE